MSDRWQDDPARAERIVPLLADVERRRAALEQAESAASEDDLSRHEATQRTAQVHRARAGLRGAVGMAFFDRSAPPDEDVAQAAGWTVAELVAMRDELNAPPPD